VNFDPIAQACLQTFESVLEPKSAIYVCGALETGREYYELVASGVEVDQAMIRATNQARLSEFVRALRGNVPEPVIDPGILRVDGWPNKLYGRLFLRVIELYARQAWFTDGWEFSHGATSEYVFCFRAGIPCMDASGDPISPEVARELIHGAADKVANLGLDASKLQSRIAAIVPDASGAGTR
jgi:hypothetical protein